MVYYGYVHECAELYRQLSKASREEWDSNLQAIVNVIMNNSQCRFKLELNSKFVKKIASHLLIDNKYNYYALIATVNGKENIITLTKFLKSITIYPLWLFDQIIMKVGIGYNKEIKEFLDVYQEKGFWLSKIVTDSNWSRIWQTYYSSSYAYSDTHKEVHEFISTLNVRKYHRDLAKSWNEIHIRTENRLDIISIDLTDINYTSINWVYDNGFDSFEQCEVNPTLWKELTVNIRQYNKDDDNLLENLTSLLGKFSNAHKITIIEEFENSNFTIDNFNSKFLASEIFAGKEVHIKKNRYDTPASTITVEVKELIFWHKEGNTLFKANKDHLIMLQYENLAHIVSNESHSK